MSAATTATRSSAPPPTAPARRAQPELLAAEGAARQVRRVAQPRPVLQSQGSLMRVAPVRARRAAAVAAFLVLVAALPAQADLRLDITRGKVEPLPIAIPAFPGAGGAEAQTGSDITQVVTADLDRSGLFRPIDPRAFIQKITSPDTPPRFGTGARS